MFRAMLLTRLLDTKMLVLQRQGRIGFVGTAAGLEAATIASGLAFAPKIGSSPRCAKEVAVARGMPLIEYVGQMFLNVHDTSKGRQMNNHFQHAPTNFVSWSRLHRHAAPARGRSRLRRADPRRADGDVRLPRRRRHILARVPLGDELRRRLESARRFRLYRQRLGDLGPLFPTKRGAVVRLEGRGLRHAGVDVDGNDALATYRETKGAVDRARAGGGPSLVALRSYRMLGRSSSDDPTRYRENAEVEAWRRRDPIDRFERFLTGKGWLDGGGRAALERQLEREIDDAIDVNEKAPKVPLRALVEDVYREVTPQLRKEHDELVRVLDRFGDPAALEESFHCELAGGGGGGASAAPPCA